MLGDHTHGVRGPYTFVSDRSEFFGKNPRRAKMNKIGQKWSKTWFLDFLRKSCH